MDYKLSCNNLECRRELSGRAVVTLCSHIFCSACAQSLRISKNQPQHSPPKCPACGDKLSGRDDAVLTDLEPSEEYKTIVLSGLSPSIIMECAGRALSFWTYQTTQDGHYRQHLYKTMRERFENSNSRSDQAVKESTREIERLQRQLTTLTDEHTSLQKQNSELAQAYKQKTQKLIQTQSLYDRVKSKAELENIQRAASKAVNSAVFGIDQTPGLPAVDTVAGYVAPRDETTMLSSRIRFQDLTGMAPFHTAKDRQRGTDAGYQSLQQRQQEQQQQQQQEAILSLERPRQRHPSPIRQDLQHLGGSRMGQSHLSAGIRISPARTSSTDRGYMGRFTLGGVGISNAMKTSHGNDGGRGDIRL